MLLALASCSFFKKKNAAGEKGVLARVNDEYLYITDVQPVIKGLKGNDSLAALKDYTENWVRKKLLLQKAMDNIPADDPAITRKVEEYQEGLFLYEYEKALINKKLDTTVSQQELQDLYDKMKAGMLLEKDVYRVCFIKLKKDAPNLADIRTWVLKPKDDEDLRKLEGYTKAYATTFDIDSGIWYEKENLFKNFPADEGQLNMLAASRTYKEFKNDDQVIFMKVRDVLKKDQPAPIEFMRDKLARSIIEKRRVDMVEKIYDKIYQDGIKSKSFEIFVP